jgi:FkbM family methyltransferase
MTRRQSAPEPGLSLFDDIEFILGRTPQVIVDVGAHHGGTTKGYLDRFGEARLFAFEAEEANFARAQTTLRPYGDRVAIARAAVSDTEGVITLHVNSHDGTHSLLPMGEAELWASRAEAAGEQAVRAVTLDRFVADRGIDRIDLLHMDIQGAELSALKGAEALLKQKRVALIYCEVEFYPLYRGQPLIWDVGRHLDALGYKFYSFYEPYYHEANRRVLSWSDALFVSAEFLDVTAADDGFSVEPAEEQGGALLPLSWLALPGGQPITADPVVVETPARAWDYGAISVPFDTSLVADGATVSAVLQVQAGVVGVSLALSDGSALVSKEAALRPADGPRRVSFRLPAGETRPVSILLRNYDDDGAPGRAVVQGVFAAS